MFLKHLFRIIYPYLYVIFHAQYWDSPYTVNKYLDKQLLELLEKGTMFEDIDTHTAKFGPVVLWTANHPAASFQIYKSGSTDIPSRYTRKLLMDRLVESQVKIRFKT